MSAPVGRSLRGELVRPIRSRLRGERSLGHVGSLRRFHALPADAQRRRCLDRLRSLLAHAYETVPFHRERMRRAGIDPARLARAEDLAALPPLTRWEVFEHGLDLVSGVHRRRCLVRARSGGTTSVAVAFFQTKDSVARKEAAAAVLRERMGWVRGMREAVLWGAVQDLPPLARGAFARARDAVRGRLLEGRLAHRADELSPERLDHVAASIDAFRPDVLQAYPSAADLLARRLAEQGRRMRIPLVVLTAEPIPDGLRARVADALSARVLTFYGARECGWIASEQRSCPRLHVNAAGVHVESDPDGRLFVTDLSNYAMPLLRYEIGDRGRVDPSPCACGDPRPVLSALEGRTNQVLTLPSGRRVAGVLLDVRGTQLGAEGIMDARFVQTARDALEVEWVAGPNFRPSDLDRFRDRIATMVHHELAITLRRVDRVRAEANGKVLHCVAFSDAETRGARAAAPAAEPAPPVPRAARSSRGLPPPPRDPWGPVAGRVLQPLASFARGDRSFPRVGSCTAFFSLPGGAMRKAAFERLRRLLLHAQRTVPGHAERMARAGFDAERFVRVEDLQALPPLGRADLAARPASFRSARYARSRLVATHTGGTTGAPLVFGQTAASVAEKNATARELRRRMGVPPGARRAYLWGAAQDAPAVARGVARGWRAKAESALVDRGLYLPATGLTDVLLDEYADRLGRFRPTMLQGYPSATDLLARRLLASGRTVPIPVVVLTAEPVFPEQRERIARAFEARVLTFYGARECGWIASECAERGRLHVNTLGVHLEALPDGRLLVTDLVNAAMPLLRYEIGDRGALDPEPCPCGDPRPVLDRIEGRTTDVFRLPSGRLVPGVVTDLRGYRAGEGLLDVQLVQTEPHVLEVRWVPTARFRESDLEALRRRLDGWFFGEMELRFSRCERIEPEANGKVRWCVSRLAATTGATP